MFLALAIEEHGGTIPQRDFMHYWPELEKVTSRPLTYRAAMQRVNKTRVNLKHYGIQPDSTEVAHCVSSVHNLIIDETPGLFGVELDEVSLASFVQSDSGARCIQAAEAHWAAGEKAEAFADLQEAFDSIIATYQASKRSRHNTSVFNTVEKFKQAALLRRGNGIHDERYEQGVKDAFENLDFKLMVVGFGIDLRRYGRFAALTPKVHVAPGGSDRVYGVPEGWDRTVEDYTFCRDFVISTALHLAEFDYELPPDPPARLNSPWLHVRSHSAAAPPEDDPPDVDQALDEPAG
jgi:hypothetical protein